MIIEQARPATDMGEYEVRHEMWRTSEDEDWQAMDQAYTKQGAYIGDPDWAAYLASEGISPELRTPDSNVCSIGFCDLTQKWYGWSHRAMCGFAIGDQIQPGDIVQRPGFVIRTIEEAKEIAAEYAEAVG